MQLTQQVLKKPDKEAGSICCKFLYVLAAFVHAVRGRPPLCVSVHYSPQHLLSLPYNGRVSGEFYHEA